MQERKPTSAADPDPQPGRSQPIPLADRRRLLRPADPQDSAPEIFTDWASI